MSNFKLYFLTITFFVSFFWIPKVFAQSVTPDSSEISAAPTVATPTPSPIGQLIKLDFRIPGIGSESGNLTPNNTTRNVTLYFFNPDVNSSDPSTKPVASFKTKVEYDSDPTSPTFGSFVNSAIDLADKIPDEKYQIVFKTDQALSTLVRNKDTDVGGKVFEIRKSYGQTISITGQTAIIGDIYPSPKGDNVMDIHDYNGLVNCFGLKADSNSCFDKNSADLNDDGVVDGVDYNLMFGSFKTLLRLGLPVPTILLPTPTSILKLQVKKPTPKPTIAKTAKVKSASGKNPFGAIIFFIILIALIVVTIIKRRKVKVLVANLFAMLPFSTPKSAQSGTETTVVSDNSAAGTSVDNVFYVKKQSVDDLNKTIVLTLTDDNGPTLGYYKGAEVIDGFARVKGIMKKEGEKVFVDISEITPEEPSQQPAS